MVSVVDIIQRFLIVSVVVFVCGFRRRRKRFFMVSALFCLWFPSWQENVFMVSVFGFSMDSAVAGGFIFLERIE